jgi:hypothetical protein
VTFRNQAGQILQATPITVVSAANQPVMSSFQTNGDSSICKYSFPRQKNIFFRPFNDSEEVKNRTKKYQSVLFFKVSNIPQINTFQQQQQQQQTAVTSLATQQVKANIKIDCLMY